MLAPLRCARKTPRVVRPTFSPILLRLYRAGVLVVIGWLLHQQHVWFAAQNDSNLTAAKVRDYFPAVESLGPKDPATGVQRVLDDAGNVLGLVTQTAPLSDSIIGYSGPTNTLIALDTKGKVLGLRVLHSDDTPEHLGKVLRHRSFFDAFVGLKMGDKESRPKVDAVTGATLTSSAIAQGVMERLGRPGPSMRFPQEITLEEVKALQPSSASLEPVTQRPGVFLVRDAQKKVVNQVTRSAPAADNIVGYKGPTDSLLLLSADGSKLEAYRLRKSFDTTDYVAYVTGDNYFIHLFDGVSVQKLADMDFKAEKVEGVSGATETSWAVAEGLKRRAQALRAASADTKPFWSTIRWSAQDGWLGGLLALSLVMTFTSLRGRVWARRVHQFLLIVYAGLLSGAMLSQGLFVGWAEHGVPWQTAPTLVLLGALALSAPLFARRQFYCHHYCPHGAVQQWLAHRWKWARGVHLPVSVGRWLERLPALLVFLIVILLMRGVSVNLNAWEPFDAWLFRIAGWSTLLIAIVGLAASLFVPMAYCRYGCPTGAVFKFLRFAGHGESFGKKDLWALVLVLVALALRWSVAHTL